MGEGKLSDVPEQQAAKKRRAMAIRTRGEDLIRLMSSKEGRRTVYWVIDEVCQLYSSSFAGNDRETNYLEGRRSVAIAIMRELQRTCPAQYSEMIREAIVANEERAIASFEQGDTDDE